MQKNKKDKHKKIFGPESWKDNGQQMNTWKTNKSKNSGFASDSSPSDMIWI